MADKIPAREHYVFAYEYFNQHGRNVAEAATWCREAHAVDMQPGPLGQFIGTTEQGVAEANRPAFAERWIAEALAKLARQAPITR